MKKKILFFALSVVLCLSLFGCNVTSGSVSDLVHPPKAIGGKADIQALIDKVAGENYTLKYPQSGNYRSAITMLDIDTDPDDEAVAFYLPMGDIATVHMLVMDSVDGTWQVVGNFTSQSSGIEFITFSDLDDNGTLEIIAGWKTFNTNVNQLSVYTYSGQKVNQVTCEYTCTNVLSGDFVKGGGNELLLLSLFTNDKEANATMITLNESKNVMTLLGSTPMSHDVVSYSQLLTGNIFENQFGAAIDGCTAKGEYNTQLIYFNTYFESVECISFSENIPYNQMLRSYPVNCKDIDSDGIIEVPNAFKLKIEDSHTEVVAAAEIYWCQQTEDGTILLDKHMAASFSYNFTFDIPEKWEGKFTAYTDHALKEVTFYEWNEAKPAASSAASKTEGMAGEKLLVIKMYDKKNGQKPENTSNILCESEGYIYTFSIPQSNSKLLLSNEEITSSFNLMK